MIKISDKTVVGEVGDRIYVIEMCRQGCCEESNYKGTIVAIEQNGSYQVLSDREFSKLNITDDNYIWSIIERGVSPYDFKIIGFENFKVDYHKDDSSRSNDCISKDSLLSILKVKTPVYTEKVSQSSIITTKQKEEISRFNLLEID